MIIDTNIIQDVGKIAMNIVRTREKEERREMAKNIFCIGTTVKKKKMKSSSKFEG